MLALRSAPEVAERLLLVAAVSAVAADFDREEVTSWLKQQDLWNKATPAERHFLTTMHPTRKETIHFSWQMEAVYVLGWALQLISQLEPPTEQASIGDILEQMPGPGDRVAEFIGSCSLRSASDIHRAAESALNDHASCRRAASLGEREPRGYDIEVVQERHRALNWLIVYETADWDDVATDT